MTLYYFMSSFVCPDLGPPTQEMNLMGHIQRRCSESWSTLAMDTGWESWACPACRTIQGDPAALQYLKGQLERDFLQGQGVTEEGEIAFSWRNVGLDKDTRKKLFPVTVARLWKKLSREALDTPSLEVLRARLNGALNNQV